MPVDRAPTDWVAVIPAYREVARIADVIRGVRQQGFVTIVVDDGSEDSTAAVAEAAGAMVLKHPSNRGKGAALQTGLSRAAALGAAWIVTLDADGQHDPADLPRFVAAAQDNDAAVLVGNRMDDPRGMPWIRRWTNRLMSRLLSRRMGQRVPDTQCGYRAYRRDALGRLSIQTSHFDMESEILIRLSDQGYRIDSVPIRTRYGDERSKIHPFADTLRFFSMMIRLRRRSHRVPAARKEC